MKRAALVGVLLVAAGFAVGQLTVTRANSVSMSCGQYWAYGGSFKSPSAQAYTVAHSYCAKYFTTSAVINGQNYYYGGGWSAPWSAYPIDWCSAIFSTHNACFAGNCNGYVGTSDY